MILVTVGTHEDPFDRLLIAADQLKATGLVDEPVTIQAGVSNTATPHCTQHEYLFYEDLQELMREARIIITHGGPATIFEALAMGKIPIVMPRRAKSSEHVDDHQVRFCRGLEHRVLVAWTEQDLPSLVDEYEERIQTLAKPEVSQQNRDSFARRLHDLCLELLQ
jgi:UDP-N-acetylglucosamine transferase subunit ALG13